MKHDLSSRAHLKRAISLIEAGEREKMFYAALELRMGIEARMSHYLEACDHISAKMKKGWRIADLAKNLDKAFIESKKIVRWEILDQEIKEHIAVLYYTPVTKELQKIGEQLGNYLHPPKTSITNEWWDAFGSLLKMSVSGLALANTGTLLGPPLLQTKTGKINMTVEVLDGDKPEALMKRIITIGTIVVNVSYPDALPTKMEPYAHYCKEAADHSLSPA